MVDPQGSAALFGEVRRRIIAVARTLTADQLRGRVPACPEWTVHELLAHVVGAGTDVVTGNLDGAPGDEWTAAHVAARAGRSVAELIAEWEEFGPHWEQIARTAEHPSFLVRNPYLDAGVHEADLYAPLVCPGLRRRRRWRSPTRPCQGWPRTSTTSGCSQSSRRIGCTTSVPATRRRRFGWTPTS